MHSVWVTGLLAAMLMFQLAAVPALLLKKNDLADVLWGPAFPLAALAAAHFGPGISALSSRALIMLLLVAVWALRLFLHVGYRNLTHRSEDVRYAKWRREWGRTWWWRSYLQVFVLQPLILFVILIPVLFTLEHQEPLGPLALAGILVWGFGVGFEAVADEQLRRFKRDPAQHGKLMTSGLWSWSRHPNYFGEVASWWGIWLIALELPGAWWTIIGPITITLLILYVSGVSMLEELMRGRPGFAEYERTVSKFFPRPPLR